jgi:hypothetical protein
MSVRATCAALVLTAACALGAEQELPVYPGAVHTRIGQELVVGGAYFRMAYFVTQDPMRQVGRHFAREWEREGLPTTTDGSFEEEGVVSAFFTREGLVRSVVLRRHLGATVGLVTLRDLWTRPPAVQAPGLVRLEGALYSQDTAVRDGPGTFVHRATVVERDLASAREQVVRQLASAGLTLQRERTLEEDGTRRLVLEHGGAQGQALTTLVELGSSLVAISQMVAASEPPDGVPGGEGPPSAPARAQLHKEEAP